MGTELTYEQAAELFDYDPKTGALTWRVDRNSRARAGNRAGCFNSDGYMHVGLNGRKYLAHRLAWLLHYGRWPKGCLDHKNRKKADNRIKNLRPATHLQNGQNRNKSVNNTTGFPGVCRHSRSSRFFAQLMFKGVNYWGGYHDTAEEAHEAYLRLKAKHHRFHSG